MHNLVVIEVIGATAGGGEGNLAGTTEGTATVGSRAAPGAEIR